MAAAATLRSPTDMSNNCPQYQPGRRGATGFPATLIRLLLSGLLRAKGCRGKKVLLYLTADIAVMIRVDVGESTRVSPRHIWDHHTFCSTYSKDLFCLKGDSDAADANSTQSRPKP
jgi:hypothetical protein